jgi:predicted component of type VI protein secretion system
VAKLIISRDAEVIQEVELGEGRLTIGRHPASDIVIAHQAVSGRHAAITREGAELTLEDLGSSNGTFVNGQRISRTRIADGNRFTIAVFEMEYLAASAAWALPDACIDVLNGASAGRTLTLLKPLTTLGSPGVLVVAVTRHDDGFYIALVNGQGSAQVNGEAFGSVPRRLADGDLLDVTGTRMRFTVKH